MGHLILSRRQGERVIVGENIIVEAVWIGDEVVRLGFHAPNDINIVREELYDRDLILDKTCCHVCQRDKNRLIALRSETVSVPDVLICQGCLLKAAEKAKP